MRKIGHFIDGRAVAGKGPRHGEVFNPATGEVDAEVAFASPAELDEAVKSAHAAQALWAAVNPQRRARVLMKFVELLNRDMTPLAELMSREHGKTVADSAGDIARGLEVAEFCIGIAHLAKGEFTPGAGPGIDMYSLHQPVGVGAGITPFNFPAMIPLWMSMPAIA
ncbi:MAG TPA: aldehyde dehydrogenase family protein, partial [Rhizomicrobium sp.]|nr:aldehyde dehydrogenase family protein [Rhizomicrobium sp.]